jgi:hypothetical protein
MPRVPRLLQLSDAVCLNIINHGHNRATTFRHGAGRGEFLRLLARYGDRFAFPFDRSRTP